MHRTTVQTLVLSKERFRSAKAARDWLKAHGKHSELDETAKSYRARQLPPGRFESWSFRTIPLTDGVEAVIGHLKGQSSSGVTPSHRKRRAGGAHGARRSRRGWGGFLGGT